MKIIAWSHNNEPQYQAEVRAYAANFFAGHLLAFRNPQFFHAGEIEKADVVICKPDQTEIIQEYEKAKKNPKSGFDPFILQGINDPPNFEIPDPKAEVKKIPAEDFDSPDLGFVPKQSPIKEQTAEGTLDTGSLSDKLSNVLGDLGEEESSKTPPETGAPSEAPQASKKEAKKKKSKGSAK